MSDTTNPPVVTSIQNTTGVIELARPKALNSLNRPMIDAMTAALEAWRDNDAVTQVLVHAPERGFCAGGDVREVREAVIAGTPEVGDDYFAAEYALNQLIAEYPKPFGALADGVIMGGGQGISMHGTYRVVTARTWASMPEAAIGFITDVGMSHTLQAVAGEALGRFAALTAYRLSAEDLLHTGLATHLVEDASPEAIIADGFEAALAGARIGAHDPPLKKWEDDIAAVFTHDHWSDIEDALRAHGDEEFVQLVDSLLDGTSPASLTASAELLSVNARRTLEEALRNELALASLMIREPDFAEGVRAVLVDKTKDATFSDPRPAAEYRAVLR